MPPGYKAEGALLCYEISLSRDLLCDGKRKAVAREENRGVPP